MRTSIRILIVAAIVGGILAGVAPWPGLIPMPTGYESGQRAFGHGLMRECGDDSGWWLYRAQYLDQNGQPGWVAFYAVREEFLDEWNRAGDPIPGHRPFAVLDYDPPQRFGEAPSVRAAYVDRNTDGIVDERYDSVKALQSAHGDGACDLLMWLVKEENW